MPIAPSWSPESPHLGDNILESLGVNTSLRVSRVPFFHQAGVSLVNVAVGSDNHYVADTATLHTGRVLLETQT